MANVSAMLTALGDPTRQAIFERLSHGPLAVGQLAGDVRRSAGPPCPSTCGC